MSVEANHPSEIPEREVDRRDPATDARVAPRARTRTIIMIGIGILGLFLILLLLGVVPRVRNNRELTLAAQKAQNTTCAGPSVRVGWMKACVAKANVQK